MFLVPSDDRLQSWLSSFLVSFQILLQSLSANQERQLPSSLSFRFSDEQSLEVCRPTLVQPEVTPRSTPDSVTEPRLFVSYALTSSVDLRERFRERKRRLLIGLLQ